MYNKVSRLVQYVLIVSDGMTYMAKTKSQMCTKKKLARPKKILKVHQHKQKPNDYIEELLLFIFTTLRVA